MFGATLCRRGEIQRERGLKEAGPAKKVLQDKVVR